MKYRKRPVTIEARQLTHANHSELAKWCGGDPWLDPEAGDGRLNPRITIHTLEGDHLARAGDWIIQGVQGEFYPCEPDIFDATYEPAPETA